MAYAVAYSTPPSPASAPATHAKRYASCRATHHDHALAALRAGQTLKLNLSRRGPLWSLSDGSVVPAEIVIRLFLDSAGIKPVGCALSPGLPAQTWELCS